MNERVRAHAAIIVGCLQVLDDVERREVMHEAAKELGLYGIVLVPQGYKFALPPVSNATEKVPALEPVEDEELPLEEEIAEVRAELERLEALHKEQLKNETVPPEQHHESALRVSALRCELQDLEKLR